jgi:hypothetical protein
MSLWVTFYVNRIAMDIEQLPIIVTGREECYPVFFDSVRSQRAGSLKGDRNDIDAKECHYRNI